jgi:calcineurin-like phosphoesterase family protein
MRFFTSDSHFGHTNIIKYCNRPFKDAGEMDRHIVRVWNETVKPEDTVYHLGDVAFTSPEWCRHIVENLNGHKILVLGNHDRAEEKMLERGFQEVHKHIKGLTLTDGTIVNLSHYPYRGTEDPHHKSKFDHKNIEDDGRCLLNGHVHDAWKARPGKRNNWMVNVGMDQWNFKPVSEDVLTAFMRTL